MSSTEVSFEDLKIGDIVYDETESHSWVIERIEDCIIYLNDESKSSCEDDYFEDDDFEDFEDPEADPSDPKYAVIYKKDRWILTNHPSHLISFRPGLEPMKINEFPLKFETQFLLQIEEELSFYEGVWTPLEGSKGFLFDTKEESIKYVVSFIASVYTALDSDERKHTEEYLEKLNPHLYKLIYYNIRGSYGEEKLTIRTRQICRITNYLRMYHSVSMGYENGNVRISITKIRKPTRSGMMIKSSSKT